jgi:hypothetical protein
MGFWPVQFGALDVSDKSPLDQSSEGSPSASSSEHHDEADQTTPGMISTRDIIEPIFMRTVYVGCCSRISVHRTSWPRISNSRNGWSAVWLLSGPPCWLNTNWCWKFAAQGTPRAMDQCAPRCGRGRSSARWPFSGSTQGDRKKFFRFRRKRSGNLSWRFQFSVKLQLKAYSGFTLTSGVFSIFDNGLYLAEQP